MSDPMRAMLLQAKTENDALRSYVRECKDEIERLRAIVDRLPVTADGVRVVPGDPVFALRITDDGTWPPPFCGRVDIPNAHFYGVPWSRPLYECYSTREAAEAAAKEKA